MRNYIKTTFLIMVLVGFTSYLKPFVQNKAQLTRDLVALHTASPNNGIAESNNMIEYNDNKQEEISRISHTIRKTTGVLLVLLGNFTIGFIAGQCRENNFISFSNFNMNKVLFNSTIITALATAGYALGNGFNLLSSDTKKSNTINYRRILISSLVSIGLLSGLSMGRI